MRSFDVVEQRWSALFNTSIGVDLRQAVREESGLDPCEDGLRSVCWRAFLAYGPLSQGSWSKKLTESRSAYTSLRDHFLKYINNPNNLHSSADPLADDESSPWSSLRQDELIREEIFKDVTRCMQDNYFFKEPTTQKKLLDVLFIYSKLNPDTGYRQGMHELLAPILWVISQDAVDVARVPPKSATKEGIDFMIEVLNSKYIEHDAFTLFCAVMQTAKSFYELGDGRDSAAIVEQSNRIHDDILAAVDPDLAHHLKVVGILPQIYSIRWIRLLFGREFEFGDVLKMWDLLFAESLTVDIIDTTCVAMLLRLHWQLVDADYTTAITRLSRFELPEAKESPRSLVRDAILLNKNRTTSTGAMLIQNHSGRRPDYPDQPQERTQSPRPSSTRQAPLHWSQVQASPGRSPARFSVPQRQLENMFQEVSSNLQRRTEGWSVTKAVRGAVGEVRKNVNNLQGGHSRTTSIDGEAFAASHARETAGERIKALEERNKALAAMLDNALRSLRSCKPNESSEQSKGEDNFNMALAKIQFVSVYLSDSDIPIPQMEEDDSQKVRESNQSDDQERSGQAEKATKTQESAQAPITPQNDEPIRSPAITTDPSIEEHSSDAAKVVRMDIDRPKAARPSLADSSFSFMLGENRHRSSFVSSIASLPEQSRDSGPQGQHGSISSESKDKHMERQERKRPNSRTDKKDKKTETDDDAGWRLKSFG